jgi:hypothetical protein
MVASAEMWHIRVGPRKENGGVAHLSQHPGECGVGAWGWAIDDGGGGEEKECV